MSKVFSLYGFPGADTDIYGNYISHCAGDCLELEGGGMNVRIWNNTGVPPMCFGHSC